jgi:hypothetical protein
MPRLIHNRSSNGETANLGHNKKEQKVATAMHGQLNHVQTDTQPIKVKYAQKMTLIVNQNMQLQ